jgi:CspA family cold shock protein
LTDESRSFNQLLGETDVAMGTVKWFNPVKGYGFIKPDGDGRDVFVHISAIEKAGYTSVSEGIKVRYELLTTRGGKTVAAAAFASPV